jgi:hypothetical protein
VLALGDKPCHYPSIERRKAMTNQAEDESHLLTALAKVREAGVLVIPIETIKLENICAENAQLRAENARLRLTREEAAKGTGQ